MDKRERETNKTKHLKQKEEKRNEDRNHGGG